MRIARAYLVALIVGLLMVAVVHPQVGANLFNPAALNRIMWWVLAPSIVAGLVASLPWGKRVR